MALLLGEGIVSELITYLSANMAAKLTSLDTAYSDGITLTPPASTSYFWSERSEVLQWPFVIVLVERTPITRHNATRADSQHDVRIIFAAMDMDTDTLRKKLYRYARAVMECLLEGRAAASLTFHFGIDTGKGGQGVVFDFSPILEQEPGQFVADCSITFGVYKTEAK